MPVDGESGLSALLQSNTRLTVVKMECSSLHVFQWTPCASIRFLHALRWLKPTTRADTSLLGVKTDSTSFYSPPTRFVVI